MHINRIMNTLRFNGKREDHNYVRHLSQNTTPINENLHDNIVHALDTLSQDASDENINFLLNTAKNLEYGTKRNSEFRRNILTNSPLADREILSNEDWEEKLKTATGHAMGMQPHLPEHLKRKFREVFKKPLAISTDEKCILDMKAKFSRTKIITENAFSQQDTVSNIKKNLDYFLLSSEISISDKKKCMELLSNFASHNYKINPQLQDKKLQVLDEVLNDIIIKTPEAATLTIKTVDQKRHGMCAAISACRKLLAYNDKVNYLSNIFEELSASPYMKIYDITQLGTGKKIPVKKVKIDFDDAIKRGYRIIDASTMQWMHNASRVGNSNDVTKEYIPFDKHNYEIFKDSFWFSKYPENLNGVHCLLMSIIKAKEFASVVEKNLLRDKISNENIKGKQRKILETVRYRKDMLVKEFSELLPQKSQHEIIIFTNRVLSLYDIRKDVAGGNYKKDPTEDKKYLINPKEAESIQKAKLAAFITDNTNISKEKLNQHIDKIHKYFKSTNEYTQNNTNNKKSITKQMSEYEDLFNFACAYRRTWEAYTNDKDNIMYSDISDNLPCRADIISKHLDMLSAKIKTADAEVLSEFAKALNLEPDVEVICNKISEINKEFQKTSKSQINEICRLLGVKDLQNLLAEMLDVQSETIIKNKKYAGELGAILKVKPFAHNVSKKLSELKETLQKDPSEENIKKVLKALLVQDSVLLIDNIVNGIDLFLNNKLEEYSITPNFFLLVKKIADNYQDKQELAQNVNIAKKNTLHIKQKMEELETTFAVPTLQEVALKKLEDQQNILTEEELDTLQHRFLAIAQFRNIKDEAVLNNEKVNGYPLYKLTEKEKQSLKKIKAGFFQAKGTITRLYNDINKNYADELDEIYRETGKESGDFWTPEEGGSGLYSHEQVKILEQMTGRPYYIEKDLSKAIEYIKAGKGGGQISVNVDDKRFSGHAMFVPAITKESFTNPQSGKKEENDVVWHDNSWGNIERNDIWTDEDGITRTDYGNDMGGKHGFIVRDNGMIGWTGNYIMYGSGVNKPEYINNDEEGELHKSYGADFPIFHDILLEGSKSTDINKKAVTNIIESTDRKSLLNGLIAKIATGEYPDTKKYGNEMDKYISSHEEILLNRLKEIKSEEEFNSLPDNDEIKIILQKVALKNAIFGSANKDYIDDIDSISGIQKYKKELLSKLKHFMFAYLEKNSGLLDTPSLKMKYFTFLNKVPQKYDNEVNQLIKALKKAIAIPASSITRETPLKTIFMKNVSDAVDKTIKDKNLSEKLKTQLLKISEAYYKETYSTDTLLKNKDYAAFLTFIDKKFDPASDEAAEQILEKLKHSSHYSLSNLLRNTSLEDFGVEFKNPYHFVKEFQAHNHDTVDKVANVASAHYIRLYMPEYDNNKVSLGTEFSPQSVSTSSSVNSFYRNLYCDLSYAGLTKFLKAQKEEALREYSLRESFPQTKTFDEEYLQDSIRNHLYKFKGLCRNYTSNSYLIEFANKIKYLYANINNNDSITKEVFEEHILPVIQEIQENEHSDLLNLQTQEILNAAKQEDFKTTIKLLKQEYAAIQNDFKDYDEQKIQEIQQEGLQTINSYLKEFCEINIADKKKCDVLKGMMRNFIKDVSHNVSEIKLEESIANIQDYILKNTAYLEPENLLNKFTKLLVDKSEKEKNNIPVDQSDENIMEQYKEMLASLLYSANINQAEFKILEAINSGEIYNFKKDIQDYIIENQENAKLIKLYSKEGLKNLFSILYNRNAGDKATETLNLLCKQTGLADDIYKAFKERVRPNVYMKDIDTCKDNLAKFSKDIDIIRKIPVKYEQFDTYEDLAKQYNRDLDKQFENCKESQSYILYKKIFEKYTNILLPVLEEIKTNMPQKYSAKKHNAFKQTFEYSTGKTINAVLEALLTNLELNNIAEALQVDINILEKLPINEHSKYYKEVQTNIKGLEKVVNYSNNAIKLANKIYDKFYVANPDTLQINLE